MLKRIRASLANPSSIPQYKDDNIFLVLLYMFVLCFIATLPTLVSSVKKSGANSSTKYEIRELLVENRDEVIHGNIENNTLTITNEVDGFVLGGKVGIILPTDKTDPVMLIQERVYYSVKLNANNVEVYFFGNKVKTYTYLDLGLEGMNFDFLYENDYKIRNANFEQLEASYDKVVNDLKPYWVTFDVLAEFFRVFMIAFIFDLICALLLRGIRGLTFGQCLVIVMYSFILEIVGQVIDSLYGLTLFSYIGSIIGLIYFFIAVRNVANSGNKDEE